MNSYPERKEREATYNQLAKQVGAQYQAFKKAQTAEEQTRVSVEVMDTINAFTVENSLLWDQITRDLKKSHVDVEQSESDQAEIVLATIGIPSPPLILIEIAKEMTSGEPDIRAVSNLVREDPGLSAKVIQVINMPLYGLKVKVKSIDHAVSMLGLKLFQRAVLASALRHAMSVSQENNKFEAFWQHSVTVARAAEFIAVWLKDYDVSSDLAYMAGLFHDCAILPLMAKFPKYGDLFTNGAVAAGKNIREMENEEFETNHCVVGHLIAKSWGLDQALLDVIRYHHHDVLPVLVAENDVTRKLWHIIKITESITAHLVLKAGGQIIELPRELAEDPVRHTSDAILRELGIKRADFGCLLEDVNDLAALGDMV